MNNENNTNGLVNKAKNLFGGNPDVSMEVKILGIVVKLILAAILTFLTRGYSHNLFDIIEMFAFFYGVFAILVRGIYKEFLIEKNMGHFSIVSLVIRPCIPIIVILIITGIVTSAIKDKPVQDMITVLIFFGICVLMIVVDVRDFLALKKDANNIN